MAASNTFDQVINREDLTDILTILEPEETPILSMASKSKATGIFHEFSADKLEEVSFDGVAEGQDVTSFSNKDADIDRNGNYVQKFQRSWQVTEEQAAVDTAGIDDDVARAKEKCMREVKRDIESAIGSDNDRAEGSGTNVRKMRGLGDWIDSSGPSDVSSDYRTPSGSIDATATASLTEALLQGVMQSVYEVCGNTGEMMYLIAGPTLKRAISDFSRADTKQRHYVPRQPECYRQRDRSQCFPV